jgi:UDP-glucose 4-epimerase
MMPGLHQRVLITGAAGFIGSHLAERYLEAGAAVFGVDNLTTGSWDNFPIRRANYAELDVADRHEFYKAANVFAPDIVFHCAASYSDPNLWHRDAETNVLGSINAAIVAAYHEAKLVYFNTALPPISSYAISKIAGERYILMASETALVCRLANIYGPRNISGPIPTFYKRLIAGEPCTVVDTFREFVYVRDMIEAVVGFLELDRNGVVDICSGEPVSIRELYDAVALALEVDDEPEEISRGDDDVPMMELDPSVAAELGWRPTTPLEVGVRNAVDWYREHGVGATYTHLRMR